MFQIPPVLAVVLKRVAWVLCGLCLLIAVVVGVLSALCFQPQPAVLTSTSVNKTPLVQQITQARLLPRTLHGEAMHLALPLPQLNALLGDLAQRAMGGRVALFVDGKQPDVLIRGVISMPTARTPVRIALPNHWVNIEGQWRIDSHGQLKLQHAQIGRLHMPASLMNWLFDAALHHYKLHDFFDIALQSIQRIQADPTQVQVNWQWRAELKARTFAALIPASEFERIHAYQTAMVKQFEVATPVAAANNGNLPLITVLKPMFQLAQQRTLVQQMHPTDDFPTDQIPVYENRAALLVLTCHALQLNLSELVPQTKDWPVALPYPLTLRGRVDFPQHYLVSALIASGFGGRVADLIGIYKEQSDKVAGSGFSFNDIAADKAGVRFGQQARLAPQQLQRRVQEGEEEDFFMPDVADMPQYLTPNEFANRFSGANRAAYDELLNVINQRVNLLGVMQ